MTKPETTDEGFDSSDCSTASERPAWWPDDWEWPPKLSNEPELRKSLEPLVDHDDPYSNCKSFEDCCKVLFECNAQMRKFFGTDKKP